MHRYEAESKGSYLNKDMIHTNTAGMSIDPGIKRELWNPKEVAYTNTPGIDTDPSVNK